MRVRVLLGLSTLSVYLLVTMIFQKTEGCGGTWTDISGEITSPNYPDNYTNSLNCAYIINTHNTAVSLTIVDFVTEQQFDNLQVYDEYNHLLESLSGDIEGYVIPTSTYYRLEFVTDSSITARGFNVTWKGVPACGGNWTNISGEITSPNYPNNYTNSLICTYIINTHNTAVSLTIVDFVTEQQFDILQVYDEYNYLLGSLSGDIEGYVIPTSTYYRLEFVTDRMVTARGFNVTWKGVPACVGNWTNISGEITSPNYPDNYNDNLDCTYYINTNNTAVSLTIVDFASESGYDYLKVYDENNKLLENFSGDIGWYVIPTSICYRLEFTTDSSTTTRGFNATWKAAPSVLQPPTDIYTLNNCVDEAFYITTTGGLSLRGVEKFIANSVMECLRLCMPNVMCTAFDYVGNVCVHYESGTGGNHVGLELWKRG